MNKMAEICFISAKMGLYTNLRDPILTIYTIFRNFRTGRIRWNTSFYKFPTSKISFCKGPPLQIWLSQKWPLFSKTEITNIFVLMDFYSPWVIEQKNPNIDDGYLLISTWGCFVCVISVYLAWTWHVQIHLLQPCFLICLYLCKMIILCNFYFQNKIRRRHIQKCDWRFIKKNLNYLPL